MSDLFFFQFIKLFPNRSNVTNGQNWETKYYFPWHVLLKFQRPLKFSKVSYGCNRVNSLKGNLTVLNQFSVFITLGWNNLTGYTVQISNGWNLCTAIYCNLILVVPYPLLTASVKEQICPHEKDLWISNGPCNKEQPFQYSKFNHLFRMESKLEGWRKTFHISYWFFFFIIDAPWSIFYADFMSSRFFWC